MKIFYHDMFAEQYALDPAAEPDRLEPALHLLKKHYPIYTPRSAKREEILLVHSERHLNSVAADKILYETALFAAGAAGEAAQSAVKGEQAFALCRPPGHHASADSCWGFCYFNNIAVAVKGLLKAGAINSALIVDFDLHYGDGTADIFAGDKAVSFWHSREGNNKRYIDNLRDDLKHEDADLVAVSAGFDRGVSDWGGMLTAGDYKEIGFLLGSFAQEKCGSRLFAVLEGGYNAQALAGNIYAFLEGLAEAR